MNSESRFIFLGLRHFFLFSLYVFAHLLHYNVVFFLFLCSLQYLFLVHNQLLTDYNLTLVLWLYLGILITLNFGLLLFLLLLNATPLLRSCSFVLQYVLFIAISLLLNWCGNFIPTSRFFTVNLF